MTQLFAFFCCCLQTLPAAGAIRFSFSAQAVFESWSCELATFRYTKFSVLGHVLHKNRKLRLVPALLGVFCSLLFI